MPKKVLVENIEVWKKNWKNADIKELNEDEITSCQKSIYLEEKSKLLLYYDYLRKLFPASDIYLSKDEI